MFDQKLPILSFCFLSLSLTACFGEESPDGDELADTGTEGDGDGDGDPTTGDGDGDPTTGDGDGDGDPTSGDGDGDGDPTTGDGDGDPTTGDGDGDPTTGDGDGDGDGDPIPTDQIVFITDGHFIVNEIGGIAGAHQICQTAAEDAGLPGTYAAWIANGAYSPAEDFNKPNTPYVLVTGEIVADNWADLTDGTLLHKVDVNELGVVELASATGNWPVTNTDTAGNAIGTDLGTTCKNFGQLGAGDGTVRHGRIASGMTWTDDIDRSCDYLLGVSLLCFQQ